MKQKYLLRISKIIFLFILTLIYSNSTYGQATDLFISEYSEGSSNNKYVEIYNGTGANVNLSNYQLWRISNGGNWPEATISLSGTLAKGDVYVVYNGSSVSTISNNGDLASGIIIFNGDDAFGLAKTDGISGFTLIDGVGEDGSDPGAGWAVAGITNATKDHTLVRKLSVTSPNNDWDESRGTDASDSEWIVYAKDTWTNIGYHGATWTGAADTDWATASNWDTDLIPSNHLNAIIPDVTNAPIIGSSTGASVIDLAITGSDGLTINSGGSLIVSGTSSGNVTHNRNLATTNWYLMSSPVIGETYDNTYVAANSLAINGTNNAIASYVPADDTWSYMQTNGSDTFTAGNGYSVKRSATGDISFTGTLNVDNAGVDVVLSSSGNRFNLLGNPYTSHIASATFLTNEAAVSETQTLWVWNQATGASGAYEVKTISDAMIIAPAQGFFVKANAAGGTFNFAESNQASTGGTFQRTENRQEIYLTISNQTDAREAKIYYIENMTTGFDVGYEGELFNGVSNPLAIYTHLVADSEGKNYQVQSLPTNNYENMIVPVGVNATSGSAITIDASTNNLPEGVNIYLEDKQDNSFTLLNADTNFNSTLENDLSGIGRFYLHTTSESLSTAALGIDSNISIYKSSSDNIRIVGVQNGTANVQMYNMLGKEVLKTSFEGNGVNDIKLNTIPMGIYIVKIATENGTLNRKIIIQ